MIAPHDLDLERELLGAMLLHPHAIDDVLTVTGPDDCYSPAHAAAFAAIVVLRDRGDDPSDVRAVLAEAQAQGVPIQAADAVGWLSVAGVSWKRRASKLAELRLRRDWLSVADAAREASEGPDPVGAVDTLRQRLDELDTATTDVPASLEVSADLADAEIVFAPWVLPGMLRREDRAIIVGFEGDGKSTLLAQVSWCASQGLHPFTRKPVPPIVVLYVDLENRRHRIQSGYRPLVNLTRQAAPYGFDRGRHFTWREPSGIDIRGRRHKAEFEAIVRQLRPDLVCLGPLRKTYRQRPGEKDDTTALDVQWHFDQLVSRYGFALLIEAHAPHSDNGFGKRTARPFGSSTWLGWPEFGRGMTPDSDRNGVFKLTYWRGNRTDAEWPDELHRGTQWPWDGWRQDGWRAWDLDELREAG